MPEQDGKLSAAEKDKIKRWLESRTKNAACPVCGSSNWIIGDHLVQPLVVFPGGGITVGGPAYPHVMLISTNCGYTRLFNAVVIGVAEAAKPADGGSKP